MAEGIATRSSRGHRTICVPIEEEDYLRIIHDPKAFRRTLDDCFRQTPELFPVNFALGYELKDDRMSAKQQIPIRRILLKDDSAYSIRPSFLMPYMTAHTADVEGPLFLRKFGVPFWALARVFGGDPMFWYRMECGLGRFSVVGTTVRTATLPEHLLADEHHQGLDGQKVYIATTVGNGCCLGAEPAEAAGSDKLKVAYQVFKDEACDVSPKYAPKTVSTDGWKGTQAAWKMLFTKVVILLCFLHGWLKIRDRAKRLKEVFCRSLPAGLGYLSRARPPEFCTTPALAPPVGGRTPHSAAKPQPKVWLGIASQNRLGLEIPHRFQRSSHEILFATFWLTRLWRVARL